MKNGFTLSETMHTKPADIYEAWMSSEGHAAMTGKAAPPRWMEKWEANSIFKPMKEYFK